MPCAPQHHLQHPSSAVTMLTALPAPRLEATVYNSGSYSSYQCPPRNPILSQIQHEVFVDAVIMLFHPLPTARGKAGAESTARAEAGRKDKTIQDTFASRTLRRTRARYDDANWDDMEVRSASSLNRASTSYNDFAPHLVTFPLSPLFAGRYIHQDTCYRIQRASVFRCTSRTLWMDGVRKMMPSGSSYRDIAVSLL